MMGVLRIGGHLDFGSLNLSSAYLYLVIVNITSFFVGLWGSLHVHGADQEVPAAHGLRLPQEKCHSQADGHLCQHSGRFDRCAVTLRGHWVRHELFNH